MEGYGTNLLCIFDFNAATGRFSIAFGITKAFIHFPLSIFNLPLKKQLLTIAHANNFTFTTHVQASTGPV
ncbi:MAG: hypothetical protein RR614_06640 [Eubacterium sp.]